MAENAIQSKEVGEKLSGGAYEIIRGRLLKDAEILKGDLNKLNLERKKVFGSITTDLITNERISTQNKCIPRDMVSFGNHFIFGYNVHIGLRTTTTMEDVFTIAEYANHEFHLVGKSILNDPAFTRDFENLYQYYKDTQFSKFMEIGPFVYMVFNIGTRSDDLKVFKWQKDGNSLKYLDAQSSHEVIYPEQHEFYWRRTTREMYCEGAHPHISIEDLVFVEAVGGDLTIKIEDNTLSGKGIYQEPVEHPDQKLEDADIEYAVVGHLVMLKILPYKEKEYRYFIYNDKIKTAQRVDAIEKCCVLLPDDNGVIFPKGIYLQTGETRLFEFEIEDLLFEKKISAPNGEDFLYVFHNRKSGTYLLLSYNLIEQRVLPPVICHGFTFFNNGEMCYFKTEEEPQSHHAIQIWKTPYLSEGFELGKKSDSFLSKIGNKDLVRAMAECYEITTLLQKEDNYANLYLDVVKNVTSITDAYYWLDRKEVFQIKTPLNDIKSSASSAIDEFEKVVKLKKNSGKAIEELTGQYEKILSLLKRSSFNDIQIFVDMLAQIRVLRGSMVALKDLRYINLDRIEEIEKELKEKNKELSNNCVNFLLQKEALLPYQQKVKTLETTVASLTKVIQANETEDQIRSTSQELEMLIDVVSNLKIDDATQTAKIIDQISTFYAQFNLINAQLKKKRKALKGSEGEAVFNAQIKLIAQGVVNYLDLCTEPEKCEEYLSKLMIQLEELEGKFTDFEVYLEKISEKREEVYHAFEARKIQLIEKRNKKTTAIHASAIRIIKGVANRLKAMKTINEINGYMVSDLMVAKVQDMVTDLIELSDTVKADEIQNKLKSTQEDAIRQLKDKNDLFESENVIVFGRHKFLVNSQAIDLTIVPKGDQQCYHITGTNFFEPIQNPEFLATKNIWEQTLISENDAVYRSEYLAWLIYNQAIKQESLSIPELLGYTPQQLLKYVTSFMASRYQEGYSKGIHDQDASVILTQLLRMHAQGGVLKYGTMVRASAVFYWSYTLNKELKKDLLNRILAAGVIMQAFPENYELGHLQQELTLEIQQFISNQSIEVNASQCASYLIEELSEKEQYTVSKEAHELGDKFKVFLQKKQLTRQYKDSLTPIENWFSKYHLIISWVHAFASSHELHHLLPFAEEAAIFMLLGPEKIKLSNFSMHASIKNILGDHRTIKQGLIEFNFHEFAQKMHLFSGENVPDYIKFIELKKTLVTQYKEQLRLQEFKPKVMSAFVRNQLINQVYLPLIGDNLAKQIGGAGANKRTDLMGMLLLISPPGYGKTTLMEYIASRLGLVFLKINGPAIGHEVVSLDPDDAPNASAKEEVKKLNLGFEMGDNVMVYLDDIQHCNPEFLQKFISLCDGQRKIEGVYQGKSKTYDLRGKKVCVVMAGNPFTESGEKFQIPDMLSNRADIYNLGDIIGNQGSVFELSYIENSLTSNSILRNLAGRDQQDLYDLIKMAANKSKDPINLQGNYSPEEIKEYTSILEKMLFVRDLILKINKAYIESAAMDDQYRKEPPFKLQGSYRNMNRITEKIVPIMNKEELKTLIMSYYQNESQTLTTSAEANLLKFKSLTNWINKEELERWHAIKAQYLKQQKLKGFGANQQMGAMLSQVELLAQGITGIHEELKKN